MLIRWLAFLMAIAACEQFGMTFVELSKCSSRSCLKQVEQHTRDVLNIDWKPMTVFPNEATRFR